MQITLNEYSLIAVREPGDPKYYGNYNAAGESKLLYAIKKELNSRGYDFIKKRMWKDGHLVGDMQQYLRERKPINGRQLAIYNGSWAIYGANERFNEGAVTLLVSDLNRE